MPIQSQTSTVSIHQDGTHHGVVKFTLTDGRIYERTVRAPDVAGWTTLLLELPAQVLRDVALEDSETASEVDTEIADADLQEAAREQIAVAYLRSAFAMDDPYAAYLKFEKFNTYRIARGWTEDQVAAALADFGLDADEWDQMRTAYVYLRNPARVTAMESVQTVNANWAARFEA